MRRDQLEHAVRTACQIIQRPEVIVIGSQAILGTYDEGDLPSAATMSVEIDIMPIAADAAEIEHLADMIEGVAGEFSPFEEMIQNDNTAGPSGTSQFIGWCLDKEDLCVAKLCALREKDQNFVGALLDAGLVDSAIIGTRLRCLDVRHEVAAERALAWLAVQGRV